MGTPAFDSSRAMLGLAPPRPTSQELPVEDDPAALRAETWSATLNAYRQAASRLAELRAKAHLDADRRSKDADFTAETAENHVEPWVALAVDRAALEH